MFIFFLIFPFAFSLLPCLVRFFYNGQFNGHDITCTDAHLHTCGLNDKYQPDTILEMLKSLN